MNSSRKSLLLAALGCMTVVVGFGQAPVKAQVNALQQLTSQMIGSSFNEEFSTTLPGSTSLVDGGSGKINRVMTDLVDSEIRRRPASIAQNTVSDRGPKTVQLLVPVKTGLEFRDIQALIPRAKILEMSRRVFVLVAETARALPAYQLGRKLQSQLGFIFELAYSDGHPDLNLAWLSSINGNVASAPKVHNPNQVEKQALKPSPKIQAKVVAGTAEDLEGLGFSSPFMVGQSTSSSRTVETVNSDISVKESHDFRLVQHKSLENSSEHPFESVITSSTGATQEQGISIDLSENVVAQNKDLNSNQSSTRLKSRSSITDVLSELRAMRQVHSEPAEQLPNYSEKDLPLSARTPRIESGPSESNSSPSSLDPVSIKSSSKQTATSSSIDDVLAELKSMSSSLASSSISASHNSLSEGSSTSAVSQKRHASSSLVKAVAIQPINLGNIPVVSSRYMAANQNLAYVYVKVQREAQIASLKDLSNSPVVHYHRGQLLARVGIYRDSRVGQRLQRNQLQKLSNAGFEVQVIANNTRMSHNTHAS